MSGREHATTVALPGECVFWLPDADFRGAHRSGTEALRLFPATVFEIGTAGRCREWTESTVLYPQAEEHSCKP